MQRFRTLTAGGLAAVTAVGLLGCSAAPADPDERTSITIAVAQSQFNPSWDISAATLWWLVERPVFEALVVWDDEKHRYAPWLAEEYEIAEDGLSISFRLREDVVFSDGTKMDAEAVVKCINASFAEEGGYYYPQYYETLRPEAAVTGEYTLELTTTKPLNEESILLLELTQLPIMGPAAIDDPSLAAEEPIGTGPYLLDELVPEVSASFVRNPDYWNPDAYDFDEITIVAMADKVAALNALKSGQIDAAEIDSSLAAEAEASGMTIGSTPSGITGLFIGDRLGDDSPLSDVRVRQALNYAIDRVTIAEEVERGYASSSSSPFDPDSREYVEGGEDRYAYDPDKARELLAEAGYPDGFTIKLPPAIGFASVDYGPIVEQYFAEIGVTIEWSAEGDDAAAWQRAMAGEVDGIIYHSLYGHMIRTWVGPGTFWVPSITDPVLLEMSEKYNNGTPAEHDSVLDDLAKYVLEQAWIVSISQPEAIWASSPEFEVRVSGGPAGAFLARLAWFHLAD